MGSDGDEMGAARAMGSTGDEIGTVRSTDSLENSKKAVRSQVLRRRNAMSEDARRMKSERICSELSRMLDDAIEQDAEHSDPPIVAAYSAMNSEVDVGAFLQVAFERGCIVALPCMVRATGESDDKDACAPPAIATPTITSLAVPASTIKTPPARTRMQMRLVSRGAFNSAADSFINHPLKAYTADDPQLSDFPLCNPQSVDFAVVPLVAYDDDRNRLGYGGGNYDRFLNLLRSDAIVVGVTFSEQHVDAVPLEPHDLPLPAIIAF